MSLLVFADVELFPGLTLDEIGGFGGDVIVDPLVTEVGSVTIVELGGSEIGGGTVVFEIGGGSIMVDDTTGGGVVTGSDGFTCVSLGMGVSTVVEIPVTGPVTSVGIVTMVEVGGSRIVVGAVVGIVAFWSGSATTLVTTETTSLRTEVMGSSGFFAVVGIGVVEGCSAGVEETMPVGAIVIPVGVVVVVVGATDTMLSSVVAAVVVAVTTVELPGLFPSSSAFDVGTGAGRWLIGGLGSADSGSFDFGVLGAALADASGVAVGLVTSSEADGSVEF